MTDHIAKEAERLSYEPENLEELINGQVDWDGKEELKKLSSKLFASKSIKKYARGAGIVPLDKQEIWQVAIVSQKYGLDPLAKHVVWYQDQPYITVSGLLFVAQNKPDFDAIQLEIVVGDERAAMIEAMGLDDEGQEITVVISSNKSVKKTVRHCVVRARLYKKGSPVPTICYATASVADVGGKLSEETKNISAMAATRATGRACRTAYGIGMPIYEEANQEREEKKPASFSESFKGE